MSIDYLIKPGGSLIGCLRVPGDKSISHRSVIVGSLAEGTSRVSGLLEGEDVLATIAAFRALGVEISDPQDGRLRIEGIGLRGLHEPRAPLDLGNSGTAMRLLAGALAAQPFDTILTGDASLRQRPMRRVAEPLNAMGAAITTADNGRPPLMIQGGRALHGIDYKMPVASAQVKSAILLAAMYASGTTVVNEPVPTRDHTERMLRAFGYEIETQGRRVRLHGGGRLHACDITVPGDLSSAAFFLVGATIAKNADVLIEGVGVNPTRTGVLELLERMGARLELIPRGKAGGEPIADIRACSSALQGIVMGPDDVSRAIDEFPALFIAAACARGETVLRGAEELRVKESDRIAVMARGLSQLGIDAKERPDGIIIRGGVLSGGNVQSFGDHRVAMAFAIAGLVAPEPIRVHDCKNVDTSFPGFAALAVQAGLEIKTVNRTTEGLRSED
jgi:3-phosphoshikimate 1-carboxyvinyltransferase